jgi:hypothetical protein
MRSWVRAGHGFANRPGRELRTVQGQHGQSRRGEVLTLDGQDQAVHARRRQAAQFGKRIGIGTRRMRVSIIYPLALAIP